MQAFFYPLVGLHHIIKVEYNPQNNTGLSGLLDLSFATQYTHFQQLVHQHVAIVTIDDQRFLVSGWECRGGKRKTLTNQTLSQVKQQTMWWGEVMVIVLGK